MTDPAGNLIAAAAKVGLGTMGLARFGRSRTWVDDHGWWLINVEFQPSRVGQGCYLNVGEQHLWVPRDYHCFERPERPLGGSTFVSLAGDDAAAAIDHVVTVAAEVVTRRRAQHGDGINALEQVANSGDDLNAGIAAAVLGDRRKARRHLHGNVHEAFRSVANRYVDLDTQTARELATVDARETRDRLRLPAPWPVPFW